jgi:preprotein translocase subunit SecF
LVVGAGIMGAVTLEEFSVALLVGLVVGAYSSIGVAAPVLVWLKEHEAKYRTIRERLAAQGVAVDSPARRPSGARLLEVEDLSHHETDPGALGGPDDDDETGGGPAPAPRPTPPRTPAGAIPPRPRKKSRKH